ncbi:hypothetical protein TPHA_0A01810 [Tetrapisispora phaffii CBS 4417]|uniref:Integrase zinc-binding domain-containing protein n=1 Tax=Tetrapisispora phaffii (strain ATCC 24235 / CBS 4417 / NBRC 1672 / NRRL Y-8282 / UCD 70-5) TaxID=1071381 RepID=G8BMY6_TETPH|nr:hypothetical protein TPHA_0A01810 [Tetrapisispora phaffii CBS 4417]CCE61264.1 hypothetical protein TPHA_0A01810 [Tetrapisispora phaffii CBS 4417]
MQDEKQASEPNPEKDRNEFKDPEHVLANIKYIIPRIGQKYDSLITPLLDKQLLQKGEIAVANSKTNYLSKELYDLVKNDDLTRKNVAVALNLDEKNAITRLIPLKHRYYRDSKLMVHDRSKQNKIVIDPAHRFRMVMTTHLLNDHLTRGAIYRTLSKCFANLSDPFIKTSIEYCSICNSNKKNIRRKKEPQLSNSPDILFYERLILDVVAPFGAKKIQKRYTHILTITDFHTKFMWSFPLKNLKLRTIISKVTEFIVALPVKPVFISSFTLSLNDIFELCCYLAREYNISIGLGTRNMQKAYSKNPYVTRILNSHKTECLKSWFMCLKWLADRQSNSKFDIRPPNKNYGLFSGMTDFLKKYEERSKMIIGRLPSENFINIDEGSHFIYSEDEFSFDNLVEKETPKKLSESVVNSSEDSDDNYEDNQEDNYLAEGPNRDDTILDYNDTFTEAESGVLL